MARKESLSPEKVVAAAVSLADETGLERLTMRALGDRLGVTAMSLYNHVHGKEALVDAMVDEVFLQIALPTGDDWRDAMRRRARSLRDVLRSHPWATGLLDNRTAPGPNNLAHHEAMLGALRSRGIDVHEATFAYGLLDAFVYGFVLQETARPYASPEEFGDVAADMADVMPAEDYPHLAAAAAELTTSGYDLADQFDEALDLVLDAIETRWAGTVA